MRYVWTYLVVVVVFAFGFLCASAFTLGDDEPRASGLRSVRPPGTAAAVC